MENIRTQVLENMRRKDIGFFRRFSDKAKNSYLNGVAFADGAGKAMSVSSKNFEKFLRPAVEMTLYWCFSAVQLATILEKAIQDKIVGESMPAEAVSNFIPKIDTPLLRQRAELVGLKKAIDNKRLEDIKKDSKLLNKLERHRKRYAWIEIANWIGSELTLEGLINQIRHIEDSQDSANDVESSPELGRLFEYLKYTGYAKQAGAEYIAMYAHTMRPFLDRVASRLNITYREMMRLTHNEIIGVLERGGNSRRLSNSRKNMRWALLTNSEGQAVLVDDKKDVAYLEKMMIPGVDGNARTITGEVGGRGTARGTARVVMNVDDFGKMRAGDVLVTTMTTPDFVILMQKASAIVTDIGGMLSHAAIMSREMKIPCVIGTKVATRVLKDGDMVEVDADRGIVRIIT